MHIIGLPGSGKTTLAKKLSKELNLPIYNIGMYRIKYPETIMGEASAWVRLFYELSKRNWKNCILETTGLNKRENFLTDVLLYTDYYRIKLTASKKILYQRINKKKIKERGGKWLYSDSFKNKYDFVNKMFKLFKNCFAHLYINTENINSERVFNRVLKEIKLKNEY
jgi:hypothetical protein